jgi:hypothetical protein
MARDKSSLGSYADGMANVWRRAPGIALGVLGAGAGAITVAKTVAAVGAGRDLSPQQVAFYFGATVIALYVAAAAGVACLSGVVSVGAALTGSDEDHAPRAVTIAAIVVGAVVALGVLALLVDANVLYNYDGTDSFGRGFVGILGLLGAGIAIAAYKLAAKERKEEEERNKGA